ncbi:MAG: DUF3108 domain-containing protein [Kiritimatiellae bacterium]|nr:DUF3108 domain-containing protein [Kiritimatiellia bacterium]MCO5068928.1 DUF3108 domain-containing protein [Kiritimatiellia bacterium]
MRAFAAILALLFTSTGFADSERLTPVSTNRPPAEVGFRVGEVLLYRLKWGIIPVGTARIVSDWTEDTPPTVRIRLYVQSNSFLDRLYRIDDRIETIAEPSQLLPFRFEKQMNEGGVLRRDVTTFDREIGRVSWSNLLEAETRSYEAPRDIRDIVSMMFALRSTPFNAGDETEYVITGDNGPAPVKIRVLEHRTFKTDRYGSIPAIHIRPTVNDDGLFLGRTPRDLWISESLPHVLLLLSVDAPIGTIRLILDAVEGVEEWPPPS